MSSGHCPDETLALGGGWDEGICPVERRGKGVAYSMHSSWAPKAANQTQKQQATKTLNSYWFSMCCYMGGGGNSPGQTLGK